MEDGGAFVEDVGEELLLFGVDFDAVFFGQVGGGDVVGGLGAEERGEEGDFEAVGGGLDHNFSF